MRAKKWLSFITLGCSLVALLTAVAVGNISGSMVYDIALAVFGSALLGFIMSLIEYLVERRHAMETFWDEARKAVSLLRSIKYIDLDAPAEMILACFQEERANAYSEMLDSPEAHSAKDALIGWFEENQPMNWTEEDDIGAELDRIYTSRMHSYRDSFMRCIESCVSIADIDLGPLGNAYGSLDFLFENSCVRKTAYDQIYSRVFKFVDLIRENLYHFKKLMDGQGSFPVCARKVYDIHQKAFTEKLEMEDGFEVKLVYQSLFDDIDKALEDFRCKIYRHVKPEYSKPVPVLGATIFFDESDTNTAKNEL